MDGVMKTFVEEHITAASPVHWLSEVPGVEPYPHRSRMNELRNWRTCQASVNADLLLSGELDELLWFPEQSLAAPWDYKSKGSPPDEGYTEQYYQSQGDIYHFLLEGKGIQCTGDAYFTYLWPEAIEEAAIKFGHLTVKIGTDPKRAADLAIAAAACLAGPEPAPGINTYKGKSSTCEYCVFISGRSR